MTITGNRLHQSRRELGIKLTSLADDVGVSPSYLSKIETGRAKTLSIELIAALAAALDIRPEYLAGWSDDATGEDLPASVAEGRIVYQVDSPSQYRLIQELIDLFSDLPREDQDALLQLARRLRTRPDQRIIG